MCFCCYLVVIIGEKTIISSLGENCKKINNLDRLILEQIRIEYSQFSKQHQPKVFFILFYLARVPTKTVLIIKKSYI